MYFQLSTRTDLSMRNELVAANVAINRVNAKYCNRIVY